MTEYEPGWYHVEGDPPGTMRMWDGEKLVGEPIAQDTEFVTHADLFARGLATFFDLLFLCIGALVVAVSTQALIGNSIATATVGVVWVGFYEIFQVVKHGTTPGKRMFSLVIVDTNLQSPPGWLVALVRVVPVTIAYALISRLLPSGDATTEFIAGFGMFFGFLVINAITIMVTPRHISLYDVVAGTQVVAQPSSDN